MTSSALELASASASCVSVESVRMSSPKTPEMYTMPGTMTKHAMARRALMKTMKPNVKKTCITERSITLTLSCTWSDTFWQSALSLEVMSPVFVAPKKSISCRISDSNRRTRRRLPKRPPMTMKVEPRMPVKMPVASAVPSSASR